METILLVEDDAALSEGIALAFSQQPYEFVRCASLAEARQALQVRAFSLVLLDLGLPDGSGLELCRQLRDRRDPVPVLFLTANDTEYSEVAALEAGGDDYITKPFSLAVLRARVTAAAHPPGWSWWKSALSGSTSPGSSLKSRVLSWHSAAPNSACCSCW